VRNILCKRLDCQKTKKSVLKVTDNVKFAIVSKIKAVFRNDFIACIGTKVKKDNQTKLVFGQAEG